MKTLRIRHRTQLAKCDVAVLRDEVRNAPFYRKERMPEEIGKLAIKCIQRKESDLAYTLQVTEHAKKNGIIKLFHNTNVHLVLKSIQAAVKHAFLLDVHGFLPLFELHNFNKLLDIIDYTNIFAVNMGEDGGLFGEDHCKTLSARILNGSSSLRRWFLEMNRQRRTLLQKYHLVSAPNSLTVFSIARIEDRRLWGNDQTLSRLAWMRASEEAYECVDSYNIALQSTLTNFSRATASFAATDSEAASPRNRCNEMK